MLHSTVMWLNAPATLVKSKRDPDLAAFGKDECFGTDSDTVIFYTDIQY